MMPMIIGGRAGLPGPARFSSREVILVADERNHSGTNGGAALRTHGMSEAKACKLRRLGMEPYPSCEESSIPGEAQHRGYGI